jgi:hypothetical protein
MWSARRKKYEFYKSVVWGNPLKLIQKDEQILDRKKTWMLNTWKSHLCKWNSHLYTDAFEWSKCKKAENSKR